MTTHTVGGVDRGYHPWHSFMLKRNLQAFEKHCTDLVLEERANLAVHARSLSMGSLLKDAQER